jgi:AcrR family transcriptional regulator
VTHPGGGRPARRSPEAGESGGVERPPLLARTRRAAQVVACSRRVLEDEGPDALTMRRVADELGIRAPSIYKHFRGKADLTAALVEQGLDEMGTALHRALACSTGADRVGAVLEAYRRAALGNPNLYRLATVGPLARDRLPPGLEEWAGSPFVLATGDPFVAQALWSFAHGMVVLELDGRFPEGCDLRTTWAAGAIAFAREARDGSRVPRGRTGRHSGVVE